MDNNSICRYFTQNPVVSSQLNFSLMRNKIPVDYAPFSYGNISCRPDASKKRIMVSHVHCTRADIPKQAAMASDPCACACSYGIKIYLCPVRYRKYLVFRHIIREKVIQRLFNLFFASKLKQCHHIKIDEHYHRKRLAHDQPSFNIITAIDLDIIPNIKIPCREEFSCNFDEFTQVCI